MRVLGVDCGSRTTGFGLIQTDGPECTLIECGVVRVQTTDSMAERLRCIFVGLSRIIDTHDPEAAAFESVFHSSNVQSALKLGQARGVSILAAARAGVRVYEYSPLEVKGAVTGYGRAEKSQVQQMVRSILRLDSLPEPFDASDALAVAICHAHSHRMKEVSA